MKSSSMSTVPLLATAAFLTSAASGNSSYYSGYAELAFARPREYFGYFTHDF